MQIFQREEGLTAASARTLKAQAKSVAEHVAAGRLSREAALAFVVDFRESSAKLVVPYRLESAAALATQIGSLSRSPSRASAVVAAVPQSGPAYIRVTNGETRVVMVEMHTRYESDIASLRLIPRKVRKLIVARISPNKSRVDLMFDRPESHHPHGTVRDYYEYHTQAVQELLGTSLKRVDLEPALLRLRDEAVARHRTVLLAGGDTRHTVASFGVPDVRGTASYGGVLSHVPRSLGGDYVWTLSSGASAGLSRDVVTRISAADSSVRFGQHTLAIEIDYVLRTLAQWWG